MKDATTPVKIGLTYRPSLWPWIEGGPKDFDCLLVWIEGFIKTGQRRLRSLANSYPIIIRSSRLSLGSPGPLDPAELSTLANAVVPLNPLWIVEFLGFRHSQEVDLGYNVPFSLNERTLSLFADHVKAAAAASGQPFLIECTATPIAVKGTLPEPAFLNELCEAASCGIVLNATTLVVNATCQGYDPESWLKQLDHRHIRQLSVGAGVVEPPWDKEKRVRNTHEIAWPLARSVVNAAPVEAVILEHYGRAPTPKEVAADLARLRTLVTSGALEPTR